MRRRSRRRRPFRRTRLAGSLALLVVAAGLAVTATNTVASSRADDVGRPMDVNDVKPAECAGITLTRILTGSGVIVDANGNASLILGSAGIDTISGRNRDDCIVGGAGADAINGGGGADVCIGGPGIDTFVNCSATYQ